MQRQHLRPDERNQVFRFMAMEAIANEPMLDGRIKSVRKSNARDLGLVRSKLAQMVRDLYDTVPYDELVSLQANAKALKCVIGVKGVQDDKDLQRYGRWLSYEELDTIIKACDDKCLMCSLDASAVRKCELRKVLNRIGGYAPQCGCNV